MHYENYRLNAPSGAGCFLAKARGVLSLLFRVLMHLLVRGDFWGIKYGWWTCENHQS